VEQIISLLIIRRKNIYIIGSCLFLLKDLAKVMLNLIKMEIPISASYQMGDKGSAQVFGNTEAYVPAVQKLRWKGEE